VIVEPSDGLRGLDASREYGLTSGTDNGDDDASYDYCDDICTHGEDDDDDDSVATLESEPAPKDDFFLSVPSGLMKDLDEAHAAAKLACSSSALGVCTEDSSLAEEMQDIPKSVSSSILKPSMGALDVEVTVAAPTTKSQPKVPTTTTSAINLSRASNKKRRKQLKLVKKAQAAASAAQALSARAAANAKISKGKKIAASPVSSSLGSRKVANYAVACALETMASYRKEVLCS